MAKFPYKGRIVMIGYGSVGRCTMPLIERHFDMPLSRVTVIDGHDHSEDAARFIEKGVTYIVEPLHEGNYTKVLSKHLGKGDLLINLSVEVDSLALITWCQKQGVLYEDTCIEPWANYYDNTAIPEEQRTNYFLRHRALEAAKKFPKNGPSALLTHGANPGLVTHFIKRALLDIARMRGLKFAKPANRDAWAKLMRDCGVKTIHVAEHDQQVTDVPKMPGEFVNTWSVDGFVSEGQQPAEMGWGTHERNFPRDGRRHDSGAQSAIYLMQPGCATRVRTWTPRAGHIHGWAITHGESISISDYLTVREHAQVVYRPTVHYAYHPCDDAVLSLHEFCGRNYILQDSKRIMLDEISSGGIDELGVLLAGHKKNAYWYGSQLSIDEARKLAPHNSATSLQVTVSCLSGMIWAMENPNRGVTEPDEMDFRRNLEIAMPYLGPVVGEYTEWTPLSDRERLFAEDIDKSDPWQFKNVRVV